MPNGIDATFRLTRPGVPAGQAATWQTVLTEFAAEIPDPERVEVIITDEFEKVAGEYRVQAVDQSNESETAEQYRASRSDGARAAALTVRLPHDKDVVVVGSPLYAHGVRSMRHTLLHEAQHVRLNQHGDTAHAVHRRTSFTLPSDDITWEYLWIAESSIDEFRCERTVHERGWTDPSNTNSPQDVDGVEATFHATRAQYRRNQNVRAAYENGIASLERLATVLAYGAAGLATGVVTAESWAEAPAMGRVLDVLEELPGTSVVVPRETLIDTAVQLAKRLRRLLQEQGFDCYFLDDGTLWFEVR
ncbi:hypothetical protein ABZ738_28105 [Micromonospora sp. NPDC047793]|uniref:hypothetical protein n=1 Tax=Micromonospora sp. NPDC047793 TaxID=3154342 RepID=UPI0033E1279C